jgi:hypothetical protein
MEDWMESYSKDNKYRQSKMDKKDSQIIHAKKRARERMNLHLSKDKYNAILKAIQGQKVQGIEVKFMHSQSYKNKKYSLWIEHLQKMFDVIYDSERGTIVTFLPHDGSQVVSGYYDVFGNKINMKATYGFEMKFELGKLICASLTLIQLDIDRWYIEEWDRTLVMKDDGYLHEIIV